MNSLRCGRLVTLMDTNCHRVNPRATSPQCHPESRGAEGDAAFPAFFYRTEAGASRSELYTLRLHEAKRGGSDAFTLCKPPPGAQDAAAADSLPARCKPL